MKPTLKQRLLSGALMALIAVNTSLAGAERLSSVDVRQGAALQVRGALLLDVREASEYAHDHAPGSTLSPLGQLEQRLQELARYKDKPVVLICRSGRRSAQALKLLEKAGFSAAANIEGGMIAWKDAGLPVIAGASH